MKIFLAGTPGAISREREWIKLYSRRLLSYWDIQQNQFSAIESFNLIEEYNENLSGGNPRRDNIRRS